MSTIMVNPSGCPLTLYMCFFVGFLKKGALKVVDAAHTSAIVRVARINCCDDARDDRGVDQGCSYKRKAMSKLRLQCDSFIMELLEERSARSQTKAQRHYPTAGCICISSP